MRNWRSFSRGFTLIELMLVVAIIGLLAAIAIPKFANLVIKAKEAAIKGALGALRSAMSLYYADNEGFSPTMIAFVGPCLTAKYMDAIPAVEIPTFKGHGRGNLLWQFVPPGVDYGNRFKSYGDILSGSDDYPWGYDTANGRINVNCLHTDSRGTTWSLW